MNPEEYPCWFCGCKDGRMEFSLEFDTPVHMSCVRREADQNNPEAILILLELTF